MVFQYSIMPTGSNQHLPLWCTSNGLYKYQDRCKSSKAAETFIEEFHKNVMHIAKKTRSGTFFP